MISKSVPQAAGAAAVLIGTFTYVARALHAGKLQWLCSHGAHG